MTGFGGIEEMEESWQDLAPESASTPMDDVLDTGREAYLRTKQLLDEAATVGKLLFVDEEDMSQRYLKAYERQNAVHEAVAPSNELMADATNDKGGFSQEFLGGVLAPTAGKATPLGATNRRPEEQRFCKAFMNLQGKVKSLPPGHRLQPSDIAPIVHDMYDCAWEAENAARDLTERLRELGGDGSPAVAEAAATARELSLEKDTWGLLLMMNGADEEDRVIKERTRRGELSLVPLVPGPNASDEEVIRAMRTRDAGFRRVEHVVRWLQDVVKSRLDDLAPAARVRRGGGLGWSATLESLALSGTAHKSEVAQMHPDANLRKVDLGGSVAGGIAGALKVMPLVGKDDMDEEELVRTAWLLVRAGLLGDAKRLCEDRGQPWRAAAMSGGAVVGCRGMSYAEENTDEEIESRDEADGAVYNPGQGFWQDMCWKLSVSLQIGADGSQGLARSVAQHEAALFAHLAGNTKLLLDSELTRSWEDQAWVHFCTLLQLKVLDERIRHRRVQAALSSRYPGVPSLSTDERLRGWMRQPNPPQTPASVFVVLSDASRGRERMGGRGWYRQAQQALIMGEHEISEFLAKELRGVARGGTGPGLEQGGEGDRKEEEKADTPPGVSRSPQQLRFAAHFALVLEAQCPYLTMIDETMKAIHDAVRGYTEHLAKTQQVGLVATYAATLPVRQRRDLYAGFLRSLEGDEVCREALEQAEEHISRDVPAILKQVVEDVRLRTPSAAPRVPTLVPEGDVEKIKALSWLLDHPQMRAEAVVQTNALARHLVLQKYQGSAVGGSGAGRPSSAFFDGGASLDETPMVLSGRVEAVGLLLEHESAGWDDSELAEAADGAGADATRELECWTLLLEARAAYVHWVSVIREQEREPPRLASSDAGALELPGAGGVGDVAVRQSAADAMVAVEGVLTFEDGWMYPKDPSDSPDLSDISGPSAGSLELVDVRTSNGSRIANGDAIVMDGARDADQGMDISHPLEIGVNEAEDFEDPKVQERRVARAVAEKRSRMAKEVEEELARVEEANRRFAETKRKEEMLSVRAACLPGLVFMAHEIAHETGVWMLLRGRIDVAREWFLRGQKLANKVVREEYLTLRALNSGHMSRLLKLVERSCTKLLECDEPRA